nr:alpha-2-macroglobulin family protein [uncultured Porphyromonas sp.]
MSLRSSLALWVLSLGLLSPLGAPLGLEAQTKALQETQTKTQPSLEQLRSRLKAAQEQRHLRDAVTAAEELFDAASGQHRLDVLLEATTALVEAKNSLKGPSTAESQLGISLASIEREPWLSPRERILLGLYSLRMISNYSTRGGAAFDTPLPVKERPLSQLMHWHEADLDRYYLQLVEQLRGAGSALMQPIPTPYLELLDLAGGTKASGQTGISVLLELLDYLHDMRGGGSRYPEGLLPTEPGLLALARSVGPKSYSALLADYLALERELKSQSGRLTARQAMERIEHFAQRYQHQRYFGSVAANLVDLYSNEPLEAARFADCLLSQAGQLQPDELKQLRQARAERLEPSMSLQLEQTWGMPDKVSLRLDTAYLVRGLQVSLYEAPRVYRPTERREDWRPSAQDKPMLVKQCSLPLDSLAKVGKHLVLELKLPQRRDYFVRVRAELDPRSSQQKPLVHEESFLSSAFMVLDLLSSSSPNHMPRQWLDAATGRPLSGLELAQYRYDKRHESLPTLAGSLRTDSLGLILLDRRESQTSVLQARDLRDPLRIKYYGYGEKPQPAIDFAARGLQLWVTTDRPAYRPGQVMHIYGEAVDVGFLARQARPARGQRIRLELSDARDGLLWSEEVRSDELGRYHASHRLAPEVLLGQLYLRARFVEPQGYQYRQPQAQAFAQLLEYKRHALELQLEEPPRPYPADALLSVKGQLRRLSGEPVERARLRCVLRAEQLWRPWCSISDYVSPRVLLDSTLRSGADGAFALPLDLGALRRQLEQDEQDHGSYSYRVEVTATDEGGETTQRSLSLALGEVLSEVRLDLPELLDVSRPLPELRFTYPMTGWGDSTMRVDYELYEGDRLRHSGQTALGLAFSPWLEPQALAAGLYTLRYKAHYQGGVRYEGYRRVYLFDSRRDQQIAGFEPPILALRVDSTYSALRPARLHWMSGLEGGYIHYVVHHRYGELARGMLRSKAGRIELFTLPLPAKDTLPDQLEVQLYTVYQGRLYQASERFALERPEPPLELKWTSLRDRTQPGAEERWSVQLTSGGKPVAGAAVATWMYDTALDVFGRLRFGVPSLQLMDEYPSYMEPRLPQGYRWGLNPEHRVYGEELWGEAQRGGGSFVHDVLAAGPQPRRYRWLGRGRRMPIRMGRGDIQLPEVFSGRMDGIIGPAFAAAPSVLRGAAAKADQAAPIEVAEEPKALRQDFAESAYFLPQLTTDASGTASWTFRMPEALTRWRLILLAHTPDMRRYQEQRLVTSYRDFSLRPQLPRFLRRGDRPVLSATLVNMSREEEQGTLRLELFDLSTQRVLSENSQPFRLAPQGSQTLQLPLSIPALSADSIGLRVLAQGRRYSDGEQHRLPLLSDETQLSDGLSFSFEGAGTKELSLDSLLAPLGQLGHARLELQLETSPLALALGALPQLATPEDESTPALAARIYAEAKVLRLQQTPGFAAWLAARRRSLHRSDSLVVARTAAAAGSPQYYEIKRELEAERRLLDFLAAKDHAHELSQHIAKLKAARNEAIWGWFEGWRPDTYISQQVIAILLPTLELLEAKAPQRQELLGLLRQAQPYMDREALRYYKDLKEERARRSKPGPWDYYDIPLDYLYMRAQLTQQLAVPSSAALAEMLGHYQRLLSERAKEAPVTDLAKIAYILRQAPQHRAQLPALLKVLAQHLSDEGTMSFFAQPAEIPYWSRSAGVPLAAESLRAFRLDPAYSSLVPRLQRWLLTQRRTMLWKDALCSVLALEALTEPRMGTWGDAEATELRLAIEGGDEFRLTGSQRTASLELSPSRRPKGALQVIKKDGSLIWGAARLHYSIPTAAVKAWGEGLTLTREQYLVTTEGGRDVLRPLEEGELLPIGARIRTQLVIKLKQGLDYVRISDPRPGYAEPVQQKPFYPSISYGNAYVVPRDGRTDIFVDRLPAGTTELHYDQWVTRPGVYGGVVTTLVSLYASEYSAHTAVSPEQRTASESKTE